MITSGGLTQQHCLTEKFVSNTWVSIGSPTQITAHIIGDALNIGKTFRSQTAKNTSHFKQAAGISTTRNANWY